MRKKSKNRKATVFFASSTCLEMFSRFSLSTLSRRSTSLLSSSLVYSSIPCFSISSSSASAFRRSFSSSSLYEFSDDERMIQTAAADVAARVIKPKVLEMDKSGQFVPEVSKSLFETGLMGIEIEKEHGGCG